MGSPSFYFIDMLSPTAFSTFRTTNKDRENIIVVGANDGQFRAFSAGNGSEKWSFIPPNLLPKLQYIAHCHSGVSDCTYIQDKSQLLHTYSVDGPVTVADVWLGTGDGKNKTADKWYTLLVFGEGKGVRGYSSDTADYLWSSSASCDSGFNKEYDAGHENYCGYYSFDLTTTSLTEPAFKWRLNFTLDSPQTQPYLGEPWSRMAMGKVLISGNEKWVGFIGGGNYKDGDKGKGFFVVDLSTGAVIWSFTKLDNAAMDYRIPASPAIVDTDNDGFVDTAYIGDLGGNIWRFKFCTGADGSACNKTNWSGGQFFQSSTATPVYEPPSVSRGSGSKLWVFWGTGDKENPTATDTHDSFFGVQDVDRTSTYTKDSLENITSKIFGGANPGWYISLATGEKVLAESKVFGGMVAWATSYFANTGSDLCARIGEAKLYAVAMMPIVIGGVTYQVGAGLFATSTGNVVGTRSMALGTGIGETPVFSQKPAGTAPTDVYITSSGAGGKDFSIKTGKDMGENPFTEHLKDTAPSAQVIHWWDQRVQP